jgi:hypothetical protein
MCGNVIKTRIACAVGGVQLNRFSGSGRGAPSVAIIVEPQHLTGGRFIGLCCQARLYGRLSIQMRREVRAARGCGVVDRAGR